MYTKIVNDIQLTTIGNNTFVSIDHYVINISHIISVHLIQNKELLFILIDGRQIRVKNNVLKLMYLFGIEEIAQ